MREAPGWQSVRTQGPQHCSCKERDPACDVNAPRRRFSADLPCRSPARQQLDFSLGEPATLTQTSDLQAVTQLIYVATESVVFDVAAIESQHKSYNKGTATQRTSKI